jgi:uncharacterized surface protein with fasciclin (FAS1) repeats
MKKGNLNRLSGLPVILLAVVVAFVFVSCEKDDEESYTAASSEEYSIVEALENFSAEESENSDLKRGSKKTVTFSTLNVALARTGLAGKVSSQRLTIFAPTDEAFAALGLYPSNIASVPNLKQILLYHVVAGMVYSNQLSNGFVSTLNGSAIEVNLNNGVKANNANVIQADIKARNGVIHAIDAVLFPPDKNLVELAQSFNPEFSILVAAVIKADLVNVLANGGPYTVFAPTNQAFLNLLDELGPEFNSLDDIPDALLLDVLFYHVVEGRVFSSDLTSGKVKTLKGSFGVNVENLTITDNNSRITNLIPSLLNVQASNGVVHVIDQVLLP